MASSPSKPRIVVVGSMNMDLVVRADRIPAPGETVLGGECLQWPGGKGANQAVAAARLGADCAMVACVGDDAFGAVLKGGLVREGINVDHVRTAAGTASGAALIVVDAAGRNAICVAPGANRLLAPEDVCRAEGAIRRADAVLVQFETPMETVAEVVRLAKSAGVQVFVNPAPAARAPDDVLSADVLIPNASEAAAMSGLEIDDPASAILAARRLMERGAQAVAVTLGEAGCVWVDAGGALQVPAFQVPVVDTTAAGDAFVAAFAVARIRGDDTPMALRYACAAGALTCMRAGAQPSLPGAREVEAFLYGNPS
ncbi:MAG: ribokinase [Phycisphaerales bacterium]|nr:ribokinase [Phycisphaerales bacterium]